MALRGGSLELIQAAAFRFLDPHTFEVTEDVLLNFDDKAAASGGCPTATVHDSGPSVACGLGSSRFVSEPEDPSPVAVDQPVVGGGCPPMIACFNKTAVSPPPAVNAGTPTLPPAFLAQVHKDPFLVPCLPPEVAARAECLNWLHDNQVSDSESFACMHFVSDFTSVVLKSFFEAVSNRWESRVRALERVHGSGSAVRVIGPQASVAAVMEAFDTPSNPGRPPKRKFESAFRPQSLAVVPSPKCPPEPPMDKRKLAHVQTLWSIARSFPDFCPKSDKWRSLSEPLREVYREQVFKHLGSFSLSAISGAIRAWSRYLAFLSFLPTPPSTSFARPGIIFVCVSRFCWSRRQDHKGE